MTEYSNSRPLNHESLFITFTRPTSLHGGPITVNVAVPNDVCRHFSVRHPLRHEVREEMPHGLRAKVPHVLRDHLQEKMRTLLR